ncbi:MAG: nucleotidyltransferase domain-containing protein [Firmicutes bacterium]|nr:nucleotidyltransferase domain-containing protein [Bacillota bacterium]
MSLGLRDTDLEYIVQVLSKFPEIEKALIFGSRAKGTHKAGSDVDIAIVGESITFDIISKVRFLLEEESPMPYFFDIVDYTHLEHLELKEHIDRVGKTIWDKKKV